MVTFKTVGNIPMFCMVAGRAIQIGMSGYKCFDFFVGCRVTDIAAPGKRTTGRDVERSMCFLMTVTALLQIITMGMLMAPGALRKDVFIVCLSCNVGVD